MGHSFSRSTQDQPLANSTGVLSIEPSNGWKHLRTDSTRALASELELHPGPVVLSFLSPSCGLCASVKRELKDWQGNWRARGGSEQRLLRGDFQSKAGATGQGEQRGRQGRQVIASGGKLKGREEPLFLYLDASNTARWGPEIVQFDIESVPCFVVLEARDRRSGARRVVGKTTCVEGKVCVLEGLDHLLARVL